MYRALLDDFNDDFVNVFMLKTSVVIIMIHGVSKKTFIDTYELLKCMYHLLVDHLRLALDEFGEK